MYLLCKLSFDIDSVPDIMPCFPKLELSLLLEYLEANSRVLIFAVYHLL